MPNPSARPRRAISLLATALCLLAPLSAWPQPADPAAAPADAPAALPSADGGAAPQAPSPQAGPDAAERFTPPRLLTAEELGRAMALGGLTVVDLRPAAQFADYRLPGAVNLELTAGEADPARLPGDPATPVVLTDRDGTEALLVAALLARRTERPLFVLQGGLAAWWRSEELDRIARRTPLPDAGPAKAPAPAAPAAPSQPKTKSAGC